MRRAARAVHVVVDSERAPFPETRWSLVLAGGAGDGRAAALEALARSYWRPVYGFVRARRRASHEDALDATQEFFLWMVSSEFLARADPARGRFRAFVKVALERFLVDLHRALRADKRGGGARFVPLDAGERGAPELADVGGKSPEEILDDLWRSELLERALARLEERLDAEGRAQQFAVFKDHFVDGDADTPQGYDALAERHGVSRVDVSNWLTRTRARFREEVRRAVLETVGDATDLGEELRWLFGDAGGAE